MDDLVNVRVDILRGAALDWAACKALGSEPVVEDWGGPHPFVVLSDHGAFEMVPWEPSSNWCQGGPIIQHHNIAVWPEANGKYSAGFCTGSRHAELDLPGIVLEGETALMAICRALVVAKFGEVVEVPSVLINGKTAGKIQ